MKSLMLIISIASLLVGCNNQKKKNTYPHEVKKLGLEIIYDKAKFLVYQANITSQNDLGVFEHDRTKKVKLASCNVDLEYMEIDKDTVLFLFDFYKYKDRVDIDRSKAFHKYHVFYCVNGEIEIVMIDDVAGISYDDWKANEYNQDFFTDYLIVNENNLNPWLKKEARKRGFID